MIGNLPASLLPREIETPGAGQIRALFVSAGNPVLSVPDGDALERALGELELCVSLDLYVNETNRHADYVLPTTTFYEREDLPIALMGFFTTPFVQFTEAVVEPPGECRQEWEIVDDISRRIGVAPYSVRAAAALAQARAADDAPAAGRPAAAHAARTATSSACAAAGSASRSCASTRTASCSPSTSRPGCSATSCARRASACGWRRPRSWPRSRGSRPPNGGDPDFPLRLIGLRELRSHNSWMHNAPLLMRGGRVHALRVHPDDADGRRARGRRPGAARVARTAG